MNTIIAMVLFDDWEYQDKYMSILGGLKSTQYEIVSETPLNLDEAIECVGPGIKIIFADDEYWDAVIKHSAFNNIPKVLVTWDTENHTQHARAILSFSPDQTKLKELFDNL